MNEKRASDGDGATPAVQVTDCNKSLIGSSGIDMSTRCNLKARDLRQVNGTVTAKKSGAYLTVNVEVNFKADG